MYSKELLLMACLLLFGGLRLTSTTTTTTLVAAMSIANQDLERYFRSVNASQPLTTITEDRIILDFYQFAFLSYTCEQDGVLKNCSYNEEKARYGEGPAFNVSGKLIHVANSDDRTIDTACTPNIVGSRGDATPPTGTTWIALVKRGGCTFEEKVKNVYAKGAHGVIIYNDKVMNNLEKMQIKDKNRDITAVITYLEIGREMADIYDRGIDMDATITQGHSGSRPINTLNRTSVLFVSISFIVLMVISLVWLLFYYIQRFRYLQTKDQQSRHLCSVTKKAIMKIPTKTGKNSDEKDLDSDCCAICIEAYKPSDCIRVLPCKHEFHKNCIDPWLIEHRTCPMCKLDVLKFYGFVFLGSEESILEYEPSASASTTNSSSTGAGAAGANAGNSLTAHAVVGNHGTGALSDLMRSRDFVIDFPRIFVLADGSATGNRETLFPTRLPERSQSSMSLSNAKDWMTAVTNKLDEQHGLRRMGLRKLSAARDDMQQHLLHVREDSVKKRRSHSADGRYSSSFLTRQQIVQQRSSEQAEANATEETSASQTLRNLTDASYAQSRQRQMEELNLTHTRTRRRSVHRLYGAADIPLRQLPQSSGASNVATESGEGTITIQINGEGVNLE